MQRRSSMFLILLCAANFEAGIVLNLILIFELFEARCSYEIVLIKKECIGMAKYWHVDTAVRPQLSGNPKKYFVCGKPHGQNRGGRDIIF